MNEGSGNMDERVALVGLWFAFGGFGTALGLLVSLVTWAVVGEPSIFLWLPGTMFVMFFVGASYILPPQLVTGTSDKKSK